ncbi:PREDICTED: histone H3.3-like [Dinoponera quadriceps]|uniref:Histone H3.3-like n=1 Tax=Dinoponera quadriceps TaxID=609295 RepID=A0A6P3XPM3_DINQU|nr:PREDICTED: histone H3.3-like [Dinoponera quadriceps]
MVRRKSSPRSLSVRPREEKRNNTDIITHKGKKQSRVLREIKYLRKSTNLLIPKISFARLVKEIIIEIFPRQDISRMQASALEALQEATEMYIVQFFEDAVLLTLHAKRVTLMRHDMILMRRLRGRDDIINR